MTGGQVQLNAVIQNATDPTLNWTVNGIPGGNLTVGTVSSAGTFQAPTVAPTPNTVTVTVTSQQDPTKSATSLIVITAPQTLVSVSVSPFSAVLQTGSITTFSALVTGTTNTSVSWSVNGIPGGSAAVGTISALGAYTAPLAVPSPAAVTVTATSVADPNVSGSASVTIQQQVQVSVAPGNVQLLTSTTQVFAATVTGSSNTNVTWSVNGVAGGNATVGTIDSAGLYTAPNTVPSPNSVTITATSVVDPTASGFAGATITLSPGVTVTVTPTNSTLSINQTLQITATVSGIYNGNPPSQSVTWLVNGVIDGNQTVGFITQAGLYKAPAAVPFPNTMTIQAISTTDPNAVGNAVVTISGPTGVTVVVTPASSSLQVGTSQTFAAAVTGTSNTAVTWSVNGVAGGNATVGTITPAGVYTAPASVPSPATVVLNATSAADPSASSTAQVTILAAPVPINVSVSPGTASLNLLQQLQFTATVSGTANQAVSWAVNGITGGNSTVGTIDAAGVYTAPAVVPSPATVTVRATSVADNTKSGTASVTLLPTSSISITPTATTVQVGLGAQFFATVSGLANTAVIWAVNGIAGGNTTVGTINANGLYFAPAAAPTPNPVNVTATSVADSNLVATAAVTIAVPVTVTVAPGTATLALSATQQFTASVTGTANTAVTWKVNGIPGGSATVGTIGATGLYTAPANLLLSGNFTITATSVANPTQTGTATVTVNVPVAVTISPLNPSVQIGNTQQFSATVTGTSNTAVTWSVTGAGCAGPACGTISAGGLYTAPATAPAPNTVTVTATSVADNTKSASTTITITTPPISVTLNPATATVSANGALQFSATVINSTNQNVTWTVTGTGCAGAACGTISAAGLYTAPAIAPSPASVTVTATSVADNTKSASATVTLVAVIAVAVSPTTANVLVSATRQFTATVTGSANTNVTWSVSGTGCAGAGCGTVSTTGLYTAPSGPPSPATVSVIAISVADNTKSATAIVTVILPISVSVTPATISLVTSQSQQFTATVNGSANQTVTWSVNGVPGGSAANGTINSSGFYVAPALVPTPNTITITATSAADPSKSASATVTITTPPVGVLVFVFPKNRNLPIGRTQQFTAEVIRAPNNVVNWTIGGVGCAGPTNPCGTISASGLYTPPLVLPAAPNITITATSQADPTASQAVNAKIVAGVSISPSSVKLNNPGTQQFTATVNGTAVTSVTWAIVGSSGCALPANPCGSITAAGLYTSPNNSPKPGMFTVTATSTADPSEPGVANVEILPPNVQISPATAQLLPGGQLQFIAVTSIYPPPIQTLPVLTWTVNNIVGGDATVGTVSTSGLYTAPQVVPTPASVTVTAASTVKPTTIASSTVTIGAPTGASPVTLLSPLQKVRPYEVTTGAATLAVSAGGNQYASWQVLVEGRNEDLTGVDVTVSDFVDASGNRITASNNAVIYLEKYINAPYVSRAQSIPGEWPDPLIPKKDPFVNEVRNAFPFSVNRISRAYKIYPRLAGDTANTGMGDGTAVSGGVSTASRFRFFAVTIDRGGAIGAGSATFKWSNDGGATFQQTNQPIPNSNPIALSDGVTIAFQPGSVTGVTDFNAGDTFWIFAGPTRLQPVWVDLFVPSTAPAGTYTGTVTVVRSGKANVILTVTLNVRDFVIPVNSSFPAYFGMNWTSLVNAHYLVVSGPQTLALGQLYGKACLMNRISCDTVSNFQPAFTFNPDGSVATSNYTAFDQATAPLANGSITPHNEQLSLIRLPRVGATTSQQFFATQNMLGALATRGWRSRAFDFSGDEPVTSADFLAAMDRVSLVRAVDPLLRSTVTTDISKFNYNMIGYNNVWTPNWTTLENKEFFNGPNLSTRAFYDAPLANGDELWWYESCMTHGCGGTGGSPQHDNYPNFNVDAPALFNRSWGYSAAQPYGVTGLIGQNAVLAYSRFFQMATPRIDVWDSVYYLGGNGDGTLFYPGRPTEIGGTTHIPVESLRLKMIRDALADQEVILFLQNRGDGPFAADTIFAEAKDLTSVVADPTAYFGSVRALEIQAGNPPLPPPINVPAAGGCYIDPVTGNQVCRVTDRSICRGGASHYYAYWPVYNSTGTHLIAPCNNWIGGSGFATSSNALLIRDSDLSIVGNAFTGAPGGFDPLLSFWSNSNPNIFFNYFGNKLYQWNPFTHTGTLIKDFTGVATLRPFNSIHLDYVSFDDRYFLLTLKGANLLAVYDSVNDTLATLDLNQFVFFDEAVFTKNNKVWVASGTDGYVYSLDFSTFVRVSEAGHHGHGLFPNGKAVAVKASSNRSCVPNAWRPTAVLLDESVDTTGSSGTQDPIASQLFKLGCTYSGQHEFDHFSWNNTGTDRFFISAASYSGFANNPLAFGIFRVRLQFNILGNVSGDQFDLLAHHRSEAKYGYFALPRASCNQQGTRCVFASSMTVQTDNVDPQVHIYVVRFLP